MKIARFSYKRDIRWGVVNKDSITILKGDPYAKLVLTSKKVPILKCKLLAPAVPTKIVLAGLNYKDHAKELGMTIPKEPVIFLKPPTTLIGHKATIVHPMGVQRLDYEAELAIVISKKAKNISVKNAKKYILGATCLNDITARDLQKKDGQWTRAKSFDTFCALGPWVETKFDFSNSRISLRLNGKQKQDSSTKNFIFSVHKLISFISRVMTLLPGDVISTGTPAGTGPMKRGDSVEVEIEGIGILTNKVE